MSRSTTNDSPNRFLRRFLRADPNANFDDYLDAAASATLAPLDRAMFDFAQTYERKQQTNRPSPLKLFQGTQLI